MIKTKPAETTKIDEISQQELQTVMEIYDAACRNAFRFRQRLANGARVQRGRWTVSADLPIPAGYQVGCSGVDLEGCCINSRRQTRTRRKRSAA
jgi:hypothetical protein